MLKIHRLLLQNLVDGALAEAERAVTAKATNLQAWIAKGDILIKKDDPDKALEAYDRALGLQRGTGRSSLSLEKRRSSAQVRALQKRGVLPSPAPAQ